MKSTENSVDTCNTMYSTWIFCTALLSVISINGIIDETSDAGVNGIFVYGSKLKNKTCLFLLELKIGFVIVEIELFDNYNCCYFKHFYTFIKDEQRSKIKPNRCVLNAVTRYRNTIGSIIQGIIDICTNQYHYDIIYVLILCYLFRIHWKYLLSIKFLENYSSLYIEYLKHRIYSKYNFILIVIEAMRSTFCFLLMVQTRIIPNIKLPSRAQTSALIKTYVIKKYGYNCCWCCYTQFCHTVI